ncbi:MAG: sigma-70 family RNA polymerase sigma factor [Chloroflexota bacterium]|nr:sigma-70 family RNA polymerase sigma factor [Chloroflexota bacterium]
MTKQIANEAEWIKLARAGDQAAFGRLVVAYQTPVYNLTYRMLGNAAEAEEAAQEAFLRAYTRLHSYDPQRPFRSWMMSIASHYCIDLLRKRRITWLSFEDEIAAPDGSAGIVETRLASSSPNPEVMVARQEQEEQIQQLLTVLSPTDRTAVTLRYWYDYSYEEIAETLNLTVSAVKSRLHRARRNLAKMMEGARDNEV